MQCLVPYCKTAELCGSERITFHELPSQMHLRAAWLRSLCIEAADLLDSAVVCSQHFLSDDMCKTESGSRQIRIGAIPSTVQVCMMCLDIHSKMILIRKYKLEEAYENLVGHPLCDQRSYKQTLCVHCAQRLLNFSRLRDNSLRARALMMELVEKHGLITIQHTELMDKLKNQLKPNIVQSVLKPNHCDLHIKHFDVDKKTELRRSEEHVIVKAVAVKNEKDDTRLETEVKYDTSNADSLDVKIIVAKEECLSDDSVMSEPKSITDLMVKPLSSEVFGTPVKCEISIECTICLKEFADEDILNDHMALHMEDNQILDENFSAYDTSANLPSLVALLQDQPDSREEQEIGEQNTLCPTPCSDSMPTSSKNQASEYTQPSVPSDDKNALGLSFTNSVKGGAILHRSGYRFRISKTNKNQTSLWVCTAKPCTASLTLNCSKTNVARETAHTCTPDYKELYVAKAIDECRTRVKAGMEPIPSVYQESIAHLMTLDCADQIPDFNSVKSSLYRSRNKSLGVDRTSFNTLSDVVISESYGDNFLFVDDGTDEKILCFASAKCKNAFKNVSRLLLDGTFKVKPKLFQHIYTIYGDLTNDTFVPLLFCLLPNKKQITYTRLFTLLKDKIPDFRPTEIKIDYEVSALNSIHEVFPEVVVSGCFFHYSQALCKNAKKLGVTEAEGGKKFVGLCVALAHLPQDNIIDGWLYLSQNSPNGAQISAFKEYMFKEWIDKNSHLMCCHDDTYTITNHVEGWHSRLYKKIKKKTTLYQIIDIFKTEARKSDLEIDDKINNQILEIPNKRPRTKNKDVALRNIVNDFTMKKIAIDETLHRLSNIKLVTHKGIP
ncbi:jg21811 [Pararge aegeria aegeria]|uniref:Jg21811 protein n=1 Tax=Pararge aegeria aegeria TaxID=348720 RepID=A0A8S4QN83_9NEOP|nr:jg21811 [Pararge aegeria aegeria]